MEKPYLCRNFPESGSISLNCHSGFHGYDFGRSKTYLTAVLNQLAKLKKVRGEETGKPCQQFEHSTSRTSPTMSRTCYEWWHLGNASDVAYESVRHLLISMKNLTMDNTSLFSFIEPDQAVWVFGVPAVIHSGQLIRDNKLSVCVTSITV